MFSMAAQTTSAAHGSLKGTSAWLPVAIPKSVHVAIAFSRHLRSFVATAAIGLPGRLKHHLQQRPLPWMTLRPRLISLAQLVYPTPATAQMECRALLTQNISRAMIIQ